MKRTKLNDRITHIYWAVVGVASGWLLTMQPPAFAADTIFAVFSKIMQDVYGEIVTISTIVAVTAASVALIVRMVSRNQRAVEEATNWLKNIVIGWLILNMIGFIVAYIQPLVAGGQYTG